MVFQLRDTLVADDHAEGVRRQIVQSGHPTADRLTMNHPVMRARLDESQVKLGGLLQLVPELSPKYHQEGLLTRTRKSFLAVSVGHARWSVCS
jgi:hypothetical protein